ncbi:MAG: hypothetical protein ABJC09_09425 [Terriglobia bacterium]
MFDQTFVDVNAQTRKPWTIGASLVLQLGVTAVLLLIPLFHPEMLILNREIPVWVPLKRLRPGVIQWIFHTAGHFRCASHACCAGRISHDREKTRAAERTHTRQQWRYQATLLNGQPVEVATEIDVNFTLSQ